MQKIRFIAGMNLEKELPKIFYVAKKKGWNLLLKLSFFKKNSFFVASAFKYGIIIVLMLIPKGVIDMKIERVEKKEEKTSGMKYILPIIQTGIGLGLTFYLMKTGVLDYNNFIDIDSLLSSIEQISELYSRVPIVSIYSKLLEIVKNVINTVGINGVMLAGKSFDFLSKLLKPIIESDKVKNSSIFHKIKNTTKKDDKKNPQALKSLLKGGLRVGGLAWLILVKGLDFNNLFDFNKLPHKFSKFIDIANNTNLNIIALGTASIKLIKNFIKTRRFEKTNSIPLIKPISFESILESILESIRESKIRKNA